MKSLSLVAPSFMSLAEYLLELDKNETKYLNYFSWRRYYKVKPHLLTVDKEFQLPICTACDYMARDIHRQAYSTVPNLNQWFWGDTVVEKWVDD